MNFDTKLRIDVDSDRNVVIEGEHFQTKFPLDDVEVCNGFLSALFSHELGPYLYPSFPNSKSHLLIDVRDYDYEEVVTTNLTELILDDIPEDEVDPWSLDGYIKATENMLSCLKERRALIKTESYDAS